MGRRLLKYFFSLLHVDYVKLGIKWNFSNVISPYYRLYYIDEGVGMISSSTESFILEPGYMYIIPSFTLCNLTCNDYLSQYFIHIFEESPDGISLFANYRKPIKRPATQIDISNFKRLLALNPGRGINRSQNPTEYEKDIYYKEYQELNNLQSASVYFETQGIILQLVSSFLNYENFKPAEASMIPSTIMEAISYIQVNLSSPLSLTHLADRANLHPDYFSRLFHRHTGKRPIAFIHGKRIERAQYLMVSTNLPYLRIAADTGFENLSYFFRTFKVITGMTPSEYKKQNQSYKNGSA